MYDEIMRTYELLFPILLIGTPLTVALAVSFKPHPDYSVEEQHRRTREFTIRLSLCTLCALLLHFILWMTIPTLPGLSIVRTLSWVLFFPLWFLIGVPLVQTKDPGWMSAASLQGSIRSANLQTRHANPTPYWPYWALFALVVSVMVTLTAIAIPRLPDPIRLIQFPRVLLLLGSWLFI